MKQTNKQQNKNLKMFEIRDDCYDFDR
jgi:hypothetical protein